MAEGLVLKFKGVGQKEYDAVNKALGLSGASGDWPKGMIEHHGGPTDDGSLVVCEVWDSREAQGRFMQERLGKAIGASGITVTPEVTWYKVSLNYRGG